jgi:hypothetical protein
VIESQDGISWHRRKTGRRQACVPLTLEWSGVSAIQERLGGKGFAGLRSSGLLSERFWVSPILPRCDEEAVRAIDHLVDHLPNVR